MARVVHYRHCRLVKPVTAGEKVLVSWIPEVFAVPNRVLKLKFEGGWEDGWVVREVWSSRLPQHHLPDFHELSKAHLRAAGDAETA